MRTCDPAPGSRSYRALSFERALLLIEMERPAEAAQGFLECLKATGEGPPAAEVLFRLGQAYSQAGEHEDAFWALVEAADLDAELAERCFREAVSANFTQIAPLVWPGLKAKYVPAWEEYFRDSGRNGEALLFAAQVASAAAERTHALDLLRELAAHPDLAKDLSIQVCRQLDKERDALVRAGDMCNALDASRLAVGLDVGEGARWLNLMDVLYRKSFLNEPPYVSKEDLDEGLRAWERARGCGSPNGSESWAWSTRACMNEQLARLPGSRRWELGWEAFAHCERGIASEPEESWHWTNLCQWCTFLGLTSCEDYVSKMLLALDSSEPTTAALEARIICLTNSSRFDEIQPLTEKLRDLHGWTTWLDAIEGYAYFHRGKNRKALSLFSKLLEAEPDANWCREVRAATYRYMGKVTDAAADYEFLLKHKGLNHYDRQRSLGRAWFYLAFCRCTPAVESAKKSRSDTAPYRSVSMEDIGRAIEIMEGSLQCALPNDGFAQIELGLAYLAQGELGKGQSLIEEGVCAERHFREMDELLRFEMPWFETAIRSLPHRTALKRLLNKPSAGIKNQIKKRLAEISSVHLDAASELNDVLAHFGSESNSTWLAVAIRAALARLTTETAPEAAIAMYKSLQKNEPEGFELAKTALKRLALEALAKGDELAATNAPGAAWFYRQANRAQPNCEAEAALAGLAVMDSDGTHEDALSHLQAAIELWEREESAAGAFGRRIAAITPDIATAWRTQKCLKAIEARYLAVESTTETVRACQEALFRQMDFWIGAVSTQDRFALIPPAIRLEIGRAMIPGDTSQEGWVLRSTYLPEMRERIESTLGIDVPSVNIIAGYSADAYAYSVELWGIARHGFGGSVPAEFQPDSLKYVTQKLEAAIREYGYEFLGVDDAWEVAQKWIDRPRAKGILDARVATTSERVHFSRLLRALVRDGVPLLPPDAILEALDTIPLTPVSLPRIVAMIRQQMKEKLPGNEAGAPRIDLAPHWERSLVDWERRPQTALEAENIHKMIDEVRSEAEEALAEADYALVTLRVKNAGVAQLVRRLLRHELPGVRVLAQEEVI